MQDNKSASGIGAKGGTARAKSLTRRERSEIASKAATARWGRDLPKAATQTAELPLGNTVIPCVVLEGGTRVLTSSAVMAALGRPWKGSYRRTELPNFLAAKNLNPFITQELRDVLNPIDFVDSRGVKLRGFRAESLPMICEVYLAAREADKLTDSQGPAAIQAEILMRGLAHVGIIALVDEATGYQDDRARDALAKILEAFVTKELKKWVSTFPPEYYKELFRLRGWAFPKVPEDQQKRPPILGKITNDIVYARLAPGVRRELHRLTPRDEKGRLKHKLFQHLTGDVGHPKLREHLAQLVVVMKLSPRWDVFIANLNHVLPKYGDLPLFDDLPPIEGEVTPAV